MSTANIQDWGKTRDRTLATISDPVNRAKVLEYLNEREAQGKKLGTLANDLACLRDLACHLGSKPFTETTRADLTAFVNHRSRMRVWRNGKKDGSDTVTNKVVGLSPSTMSSRVVLASLRRPNIGTEQQWGRPSGRFDAATHCVRPIFASWNALAYVGASEQSQRHWGEPRQPSNRG